MITAFSGCLNMNPEQTELFHIDSPCIGVCEVNNKGYCKGCLRNRNERLYWHTFSESQRGVLLQAIALRRAALLRKKIQAQEHHTPDGFNTPEQGDLFS